MHVTAHISDPHIHDDRSIQRTRAVMDYLTGLPGPIDALLVTGDLADHGEPDEYRNLAKLLDSPVPTLHCPGNHDARDAYRANLLGVPSGSTPINQIREISGVRYLLCDSTIPGDDSGHLDETTLMWLDEALSNAPATPAYVCFHHPPVELGMTHPDSIRLRNPHRLQDVIEKHPQVTAILCGHAHTPAYSTFANRPLLAAPGIASTAYLDIESEKIVDFDAPVAVAFHLQHEDRRITSHIRFVPIAG